LSEDFTDPGLADGKAGGDLLSGAVAGGAGGDDTLEEVGRVGFIPGVLLITTGITNSSIMVKRNPL
jgi:hypothetical protein